MAAGPLHMKTPSSSCSLCSHSSGPKADSSPKGSRGLGGLKSEFLKQTAVRGLRTQDQPAGSKGRRAECTVCACAGSAPACVCLGSLLMSALRVSL